MGWDYYSRLERGRKYVRANCVVDLKIESGEVTALVMGSHAKPYSTRIKIDELSEKLIGKAIQDKVELMLENAENVSDRVINDEEISLLFGI